MHLTLKLAAGDDDKRIAELAHQHGLGVQALSSFCTRPGAVSGLVIGYGNTSSNDIPAAIGMLTDLIK